MSVSLSSGRIRAALIGGLIVVLGVGASSFLAAEWRSSVLDSNRKSFDSTATDASSQTPLDATNPGSCGRESPSRKDSGSAALVLTAALAARPRTPTLDREQGAWAVESLVTHASSVGFYRKSTMRDVE